MVNELRDRVALVTGGTSGIGRATAVELATRGARVAVVGRDRERGSEVEDAAADLEGRIRFIAADLRSAGASESIVEETLEAFGRLDVLFNNAGYEGPLGPLAVWTAEEADRVLQTNLKAVMLLARDAIPPMLEADGGCIVNTASFLGTMPTPFAVLYGASKAGVIHLTRTLAAGYGEEGIRAYAVCPYVTDTPMIDRVSGFDESVKAELTEMNPSGEIATPAEVARAVVELFMDDARHPNGSVLLVDSGAELSLFEPGSPVPLT